MSTGSMRSPPAPVAVGRRRRRHVGPSRGRRQVHWDSLTVHRPAGHAVSDCPDCGRSRQTARSDAQMSRNRTSLALRVMNERRASTSSPISTQNSSSAVAASSRVTWQQHPGGRVHRGLPQLLGVHLAEALVPLDVVRPSAACLPACSPPAISPSRSRSEYAYCGVVALLVPLDLVQRRLAPGRRARLDQRPHEAEQQRQQQRPDVLAVDVGVGHQHDLVIAQLRRGRTRRGCRCRAR